MRRRAGSSSESTSSRRSSGGTPRRSEIELRLREQKREDREPLLALGSELAQLACAGRDDDVVEMRTETGDAAVEITLEARLELLHGRRLADVAQLAVVEAERSRVNGERRRDQREHLLACGDEREAELDHLLRPRLECGA